MLGDSFPNFKVLLLDPIYFFKGFFLFLIIGLFEGLFMVFSNF